MAIVGQLNSSARSLHCSQNEPSALNYPVDRVHGLANNPNWIAVETLMCDWSVFEGYLVLRLPSGVV
ncbi:unnamed protein product [Lupinus luteus]|uniref:Uncharacterized protein n=1 Tax=Lupinus luteus TaxID=3873 RepID=A0AAV1Y7E0_LUPLU